MRQDPAAQERFKEHEERQHEWVGRRLEEWNSEKLQEAPAVGEESRTEDAEMFHSESQTSSSSSEPPPQNHKAREQEKGPPKIQLKQPGSWITDRSEEEEGRKRKAGSGGVDAESERCTLPRHAPAVRSDKRAPEADNTGCPNPSLLRPRRGSRNFRIPNFSLPLHLEDPGTPCLFK